MKGESFNIFGVHRKIRVLERELPKKGAWTVADLRVAWQERGDGVFEGWVIDTPMRTMWGYLLTLQALTYMEGNDQTGGPIWNYVRNLDIRWHSITLTPDCVIQLNCGKVHTHASYKTSRTWGTSTTKEQKWSSFQMNYD